MATCPSRRPKCPKHRLPTCLKSGRSCNVGWSSSNKVHGGGGGGVGPGGVVPTDLGLMRQQTVCPSLAEGKKELGPSPGGSERWGGCVLRRAGPPTATLRTPNAETRGPPEAGGGPPSSFRCTVSSPRTTKKMSLGGHGAGRTGLVPAYH